MPRLTIEQKVEKVKEAFVETVNKDWRIANPYKEGGRTREQIPQLSRYPHLCTRICNAYDQLIDLYERYRKERKPTSRDDGLAKEVSVITRQLFSDLQKAGERIPKKPWIFTFSTIPKRVRGFFQKL